MFGFLSNINKTLTKSEDGSIFFFFCPIFKDFSCRFRALPWSAPLLLAWGTKTWSMFCCIFNPICFAVSQLAFNAKTDLKKFNFLVLVKRIIDAKPMDNCRYINLFQS